MLKIIITIHYYNKLLIILCKKKGDEGCDRTGMIVGAYRLKYTDLTF